jgi:aminoglycoside phosphotransferase family enzyme
MLHERIAENRDELAATRLGEPSTLTSEVHERQQHALRELGARLESRAAGGHVVEGHGDLRPEHVQLGSVPLFIDCLEFDRGLRILDPLDELALLWVECERLGAGWVGHELFATYAEATGDRVDPALVEVYASVRAAVRAKLAIWHLRDAVVREPERWRRTAGEYVALAETHMRRAATVAPAAQPDRASDLEELDQRLVAMHPSDGLREQRGGVEHRRQP